MFLIDHPIVYFVCDVWVHFMFDILFLFLLHNGKEYIIFFHDLALIASIFVRSFFR